jgi:hypothetical protein
MEKTITILYNTFEDYAMRVELGGKNISLPHANRIGRRKR